MYSRICVAPNSPVSGQENVPAIQHSKSAATTDGMQSKSLNDRRIEVRENVKRLLLMLTTLRIVFEHRRVVNEEKSLKKESIWTRENRHHRTQPSTLVRSSELYDCLMEHVYAAATGHRKDVVLCDWD
jgi:hypothetical protein